MLTAKEQDIIERVRAEHAKYIHLEADPPLIMMCVRYWMNIMYYTLVSIKAAIEKIREDDRND